jgi:hypothetical protein
MPVRTSVAVLAVLAACAIGLGACGGDTSTGDEVPKSTPELTPPPGADALVPGQSGTTGTATTSTEQATTQTTPSTGTATGGTSAGTTTTPAQPQQPPAATGGATTTQPQPQRSTGGSGTGGTSPGEFSQFCRDNPGACPGN